MQLPDFLAPATSGAIRPSSRVRRSSVGAFDEGHYGNTRLDGLNVVFYARMPGNIFQGNWTAGVYI